MALGIMMAGLLTAVSGTTLAIAMGMDTSLALVVYGLFGIGGGILASIASLPMMHNLGRHRAANNRTLG